MDQLGVWVTDTDASIAFTLLFAFVHHIPYIPTTIFVHCSVLPDRSIWLHSTIWPASACVVFDWAHKSTIPIFPLSFIFSIFCTVLIFSPPLLDYVEKVSKLKLYYFFLPTKESTAFRLKTISLWSRLARQQPWKKGKKNVRKISVDHTRFVCYSWGLIITFNSFLVLLSY